MPAADALQRVLSGAVRHNLYLMLEEIIIQRWLVQVWDSGQLQPETLLKEARGHEAQQRPRAAAKKYQAIIGLFIKLNVGNYFGTNEVCAEV